MGINGNSEVRWLWPEVMAVDVKLGFGVKKEMVDVLRIFRGVLRWVK